MKCSIKVVVRFLNVLMVVIVYITTIVLCNKLINPDDLFCISNILILLLFVCLSFTVNSITVKMISFPLKKVEKNMRLVANGKVNEPRHLEEYNKLSEIEELTDAYTDMRSEEHTSELQSPDHL